MVGVISILVRTLFVKYLPLEFLGYEGLFGNIFAVLSLADLGINTLITYRLYPAFAERNEDEISRLMAIYKYIFRIIGFVVLLLGLLLIPSLRFLIKDNSLDWKYIYIVYIMQLSTVLCTYFLAYKRVLFEVDQVGYKCVQIEMACSFIGNLVRAAVIFLFKNYILYLLVNILSNIITNCIIAFRADKEYAYTNKKIQITKDELKNSGFGKDIKNNIAQKIAGIIYGSTDNILISAFLGIKIVGKVGNYSIITGYVSTILEKILEPFQASIGNLVYSSDLKKGTDLFRMFELLGFLLADFVVISYLNLLNPLVELWLGTEFILGESYVIAFALNAYIKWNHQFLAYYRYSFGKYELDKNYILAGAALNIISSIWLARYWGLAGIMAGTAVGHMGFWVGRVRVIYSEYLDEKVCNYILRQIRNTVVLLMNIVIMRLVCHNITSGWNGLVMKMLMCFMVPNLINFIIFYGTNEMKMIIEYIHVLVDILKTALSQNK